MNEEQWYDDTDHTPQLVCKCLLPNGNIIDGVYGMGEWNDMGGRVIYPTHFKIDRAVIVTGLYSFTRGD